MMRILRKPLSLLLSLIMVLGMFTAVPLTASAASETITATDNGQFTISSPGDYVFTGTAEMCTLDIYSDCTLTLRDLCLTNTVNYGTYGIRIHSGETQMIISGENTITAGGQGGNSVPIGVEYESALGISGENDQDENNILNVIGTSDGKAAIGGSWDGADIGWNCGTIVINSGTVNAVGGGNYASVIGRGGDGVNGGDSDNSVTVNGGIITAELKSGNGDYIGGGSMTATYNGGIVTQIDENGDAVTINYNIEPVNYIDADGSTQTNRNYTIVTDSAQTLTAGWHVVTGNVTFNDRIRCEGDVHLIICDDMTLTASKGIQVAGSGNSLSVYGQSEGTGSLLVTGADDYNAGIGGNNTESLSSLTINGCTVSVRGGKYGAGIGGGYQSSSVVGAVTVNGGEVTAEGGNYGAGIGGGRRGNGVNFTMNGGEVTATGGQAAAGIGSSDGVNENDTGIQLNAGDVTINGGKVTAQGGDWSAGIGGGNECHCGNILITGGEVTATGGSRGAGIGSGIVWKTRTSAPLKNTNTITITGGVVTATGGNLIGFGGDGAACIGSGDWAERSWPYSEASVNISGGTVKAFGSNKGIGGNNSRVAITGGTIEAYTIESTDSIYLSWTENSDSIFTYGYFEEVTLAKSFTDSDGTIYNAGVLTNCININGVKLLPYIPNSYTVTWKNYNGTILETDENVPAGETPVYDGPEPVREPDDTYSYAFSGWSPEVTEVTEDAVYTAAFTQISSAAARIGDAEYNSFAEAYEAADDGDTVVLLRDRSENLSDLTVGKTLTLDLNGHQIYAGTISVGEEGDLTVTDTSDEPSEVGLNLSRIVVAEGGTFTMNSGTLTNSATLVLVFDNSGTVLITGNTVLQPGSGAGFSTFTSSSIVEISDSAVVNGVFAHPNTFSLTGGYYQNQPRTEYVAAGFKLLDPSHSDKEGYYQVVPHYAAQVGEEQYQFFTDAVTAANGSAITLLDDISEPYTMTAEQTLKVIKDGHSLTVNPPAGNYILKAEDNSVTEGEGEGAVTVTTTTYTVAEATAKVNDTLYETFAEAVTAADGAAVTLLADISEPYTMTAGETLKVIKDGHSLTVNPPAGNYILKAEDNSVTTGEGEGAVTVTTTTYTVAEATAKVNDTLYETFAEAVTAADGAAVTLLADISEPYTMTAGETLKVIKDGHALTMNPPEGNYLVKSSESSVTTGEGEGAVTITTTTYTVVAATAKVNDTLYETFAEAVTAANGATITLLDDISDPYTMAIGQTIKVIKDGHSLTVNPPEGNYLVKSSESSVTTGEGESAVTITTTTYTVVAATAKVNDTLYETFAEAVTAANGATITLLDDISDPYTMAVGQTFKVIKDGHTLTVNSIAGNYLVKATDSSVTTGEGESAVTVTTTTYTVVEAVAKVNDTLYETFAEAVTAANGATITLLDDISDPYTMAVGQTFKVIKDGHSLTVNPPEGNYLVKSSESSVTTGEGEGAVTITTTTYTVVAATAKVNDTLYETFAEAANAANGATITLLEDISDPYTMAVGQSLKVIKNGHMLVVQAPSLSYFVVPSTEGEVTTYTLNVTVAIVNGVSYKSFSEAAAAAGGSNIMLLADVDAPYTLAEDQTLRVNLGLYTLTVNPPSENHRLITTAEGSVTVYSSVKYYAQVDSTKYESFSAAATASGGTKNITLLRNMDSAYSLNSYGHEILRVVKNGFTANITNAVKTKDKDGVTYYYKSEEASPFTGSGFAYAAGGIVIGAATAAIIYYDEYVAGGAAATTVTLGMGAELTIEGESTEGFEFEPENPEEQCLQREATQDGFKIKNIRFHWVNIDTGITIMDAASSIMPDCINEIWDEYNQNTASIIKIMPPVTDIISYSDVRLFLPYPDGWFFPTIPYLPEALNPGNHFVCFTENSSWITPGTPFVGKIVTEPLTINAVWVPYEAAVVKSNGSKEYYLAFTDAAAASDRWVVEILSAPMASYTLKKTGSDPDVYETLKVKRGSYTGSCVNAPDNLPEGYSLRSWTITQDNDVITCYTVDKPVTVTLVYNNGSGNSTHSLYSDQRFPAPEDPVRAGSTFSGWYTDAQLTQPYDFTKYVYNDLTLYAKWTDNPRYSVSVGDIKNGTVTVSKDSTYAGDTVAVLPDPGYNSVLRSLTYTTAGGAATPITATDGVYSFVMPAEAVTVNAVFDRDYFSGHSLSLKGNIGVNFFIDLTREEAENATVSFSWTVEGNHKTASVDLSKAEGTGNGYKASCHVAPAEMTYEVTATLTIGDEVVAADSYSAYQYAQVILSDDYRGTYTGTGAKSYANLRNLVEAMLDYGSRAQIRFGRNVDNLANGGRYVDHAGDPVMLPPEMCDMSEGVEGFGLEYTGSTVVLLTETSIRHYYKVTDWDKFNAVNDTITFDGKDPRYTEKGNEIYFELKNISAKDIDTYYTLSFDNNKDYKYAVTDYIRSCLEKSGDAANKQTQDLVTAMYYYNRAANVYFSE